MSSFINNPKLAPEPLTEIYHVDAHEGAYSGTRVATVYKRHPQEHFPEGSVWAFEYRVVTGYQGVSDVEVKSNRCYQYYDDAEAAADTWVFHPEVAS